MPNKDATKLMDDANFVYHTDCCYYCKFLVDWGRNTPKERLTCEHLSCEDPDMDVYRDSYCDKFEQE